MALTPEQIAIGRRDFLKALAGVPPLATFGLAAALKGPAHAAARSTRPLSERAVRPTCCSEQCRIVVNIAGPEALSARAVALKFAQLLDRPAHLTGGEPPDALLSTGSRAVALFGPPRVDADQLIGWIADWIRTGGATLGKPTKFEVRDGKF